LLQLFTHFLVLHEVPALGGRQPNVYGLNKAGVVFQIMTQHLLSPFVGLQAALSRNLG
jgi:hypothetical protein